MARLLSHRTRRTLTLAATAALLSTALTTFTAGAPAQALAGTTFDGTDGNLAIDGNETDWKSFAGAINCEPPFAGCAIDKPTGSGDDAFGGGSKDDHDTITPVTGSVPNNKSDLERFYAASETVENGDTLLYLGWVRNNTLGTANFSIEVNQIAQTAPPAPGSTYTINRTAGDLLVLYNFSSGGKKVELGLAEWVTTGNPKTVCQANSTVPCWGKVKDLDATGAAEGAVNTTAVTDTLFPEPNGGTQLKELTFGEAAINLTKAGVSGPCDEFGSAMIRSRSSDSFNAELKDFIVPAKIAVQQPVDTSLWASNGGAMTARVFDTEETDNPDTPEEEFMDLGPAVSSSQTGPGTNPDADNPDPDNPNPETLQSVDVPDDGKLLHADLLAASAKSVVDPSTKPNPSTTQDSVATAAGVNINNGTVTADAVQSLAMTEATVNGATPTTGFSGIKNLKIDVDGNPNTPPHTISNDVGPNTKITLSPTAFGDGSYVEIRREELTTAVTPSDAKLGDKVAFAADVKEITGLHVHITDRTPDLPPLFDDGNVTLDVVISEASAHSESHVILCKAVQAVEGDATVLSGNVGNLAGATVGHVAIPEGGGASDQELDGFTSNPPVAQLGLSQSHSEGSWSDTASTANSFADVANLCVDLGGVAGCEVSADAVESDVSSTASGDSRTSTGGASFVNLKILNQKVNAESGLVQEIPGVGKVVVNERMCNEKPFFEGTCTSDAANPSRTAMTVRALHIVVTEPLPANPLGLTLGSELVIAEAHSGATFVAVP